MSQSSGPEKARGDEFSSDDGRTHLESVVGRLGFAGALALFAGLWFLRSLIAEAATRDILFIGLATLGAATVLTAVVTAFVILPIFGERTADLARVFQGIAQGDLTRNPRRLPLDADGAHLSEATRAALATMRATVTSAREGTQALAGQGNDLALLGSTTLSVAQRASESSASALRMGESLAAAAQGVQDDGLRITETAARLTKESSETREREARLRALATTSMSSWRAESTALENLAAIVDGDSAELAGLASATSEIQSFVTLVRKMARQSKLLALNAAMEAARAGEEGSGFAVVAGEVRRLARSSAEAADRTDQLVHEVLERVQRMADANLQAVEAVRLARESAVGGVTGLDEIVRTAGDADAAAGKAEDDLAGLRVAGDAMALRFQQLTREADLLAGALREASGVAGAQQARIQELSVAADTLARGASRAHSVLGSIRTETAVPPVSTPESAAGAVSTKAVVVAPPGPSGLAA